MSNAATQQFEAVQREPLDGRAAFTDSPRHLFPLILPVALAIRMVVVYFSYRGLQDVDKYCERFGWEVGWVARALAGGHGFSSPYYPISGPTALVPPLYTALLAEVFRLFGVYSLKSGFIILSSIACSPHSPAFLYISVRNTLWVCEAQKLRAARGPYIRLQYTFPLTGSGSTRLPRCCLPPASALPSVFMVPQSRLHGSASEHFMALQHYPILQFSRCCRFFWR